MADDDDDDTVPTTIAPPNTAHGLGTATARREAQEETPIVNTHRQESSVVKAEETSPGEADAAEDGRKNGRKVRKKTADTGEEAGEEAHGQQEANIVVNTWEMADTVVDTDNNNTADLLADADTAEEGPKNGGTGHKKDAWGGGAGPWATRGEVRRRQYGRLACGRGHGWEEVHEDSACWGWRGEVRCR